MRTGRRAAVQSTLHNSALCSFAAWQHRLAAAWRGRGTFRLPNAPAACERRALDGAAASCVAMKREVVKRLRQRSGHTWSGAKAEGRFIAFCALSDATAIAKARGLRVLLQAPWLSGQEPECRDSGVLGGEYFADEWWCHQSPKARVVIVR